MKSTSSIPAITAIPSSLTPSGITFFEPTLDFEILEATQKDKLWKVKLKVTGGSVDLRLALHLFLSKKPPKSTVDHEFGHIHICKQAYSKSELAIQRAAKGFANKIYIASASTKENACREALASAIDEFRSAYSLAVTDHATLASETYDRIDRTRHLPVAKALNLAEKEASESKLSKSSRSMEGMSHSTPPVVRP